MQNSGTSFFAGAPSVPGRVLDHLNLYANVSRMGIIVSANSFALVKHEIKELKLNYLFVFSVYGFVSQPAAPSRITCPDMLKIVNGQTLCILWMPTSIVPKPKEQTHFPSDTQLRVTNPKIKHQIEFPCAVASSDLCNCLEAITVLFITRAHAVEKIEIDFSHFVAISQPSQHTSKAPFNLRSGIFSLLFCSLVYRFIGQSRLRSNRLLIVVGFRGLYAGEGTNVNVKCVWQSSCTMWSPAMWNDDNEIEEFDSPNWIDAFKRALQKRARATVRHVFSEC